MRAVPLAALVVLAMLSSAFAQPGPRALEGGVGCGQTSPIVNACNTDLFLWRRGWTLSAAVLGFTGHLAVQVDGLLSGHRVRLDCDVAATAFLAACVATGSIDDYDLARLDCVASPLRSLPTEPPRAIPAVLPPLGPWNCAAGPPNPGAVPPAP